MQWGIGLTLLLEKVVGNNFVHKLWVICLLEADFNWINKIIFAKMDDRAGFKEQFDPWQVCFKKR